MKFSYRVQDLFHRKPFPSRSRFPKDYHLARCGRGGSFTVDHDTRYIGACRCFDGTVGVYFRINDRTCFIAHFDIVVANTIRRRNHQLSPACKTDIVQQIRTLLDQERHRANWGPLTAKDNSGVYAQAQGTLLVVRWYGNDFEKQVGDAIGDAVALYLNTEPVRKRKMAFVLKHSSQKLRDYMTFPGDDWDPVKPPADGPGWTIHVQDI